MTDDELMDEFLSIKKVKWGLYYWEDTDGEIVNGKFSVELHWTDAGTPVPKQTRDAILRKFKARDPLIMKAHNILTRASLAGFEIHGWPPFDEQSS